jgi:SAM-dependent methyltransferase
MAAKRHPILTLIYETFFPLMLVATLCIVGLPTTLYYMLLHPWHIFYPSVWHKVLLNAGQPYLLAQADKVFEPVKRELLAQAYGRVLEIGAGTGETVKYYHKTKVDVVYGVEPNTGAIPNLRKALVKYDIVDKYEILPFGIEEEAKLAERGVTKGSIDTIVCVFSSVAKLT